MINFINEFNEKKEHPVEFVFSGGKISYFNDVFRSVMGERYKSKGCAEKYYGKLLTKLYLDKGNHLVVHDANSALFYPYKKNKRYGTAPDSIDKTIKPPIYKEGITLLKNDIQLSFIPCCSACQNNKDTMLKIWKTAQDYGIQSLNTPNSSNFSTRKFNLSPLRNTIKTQSSLCEENPQIIKPKY